MELPRVFVFCAVVVLTLVKVHAAPVGGILSGLFGGEDGRPKQSPVDINQLLRQYYTAQSEDQLARYNPFGPIPGLINYGQPQQRPYDPYPSLEPPMSIPYQPNYNPGFGDPYGQQLLPLYRVGPGQVPQSADDSVAADHYSKQLDTLLPNNKDVSPYADSASYRSLSNPETADVLQPQATQVRLDTSHAHSPVASSLIAHRVLADGSSSSKSASASSASNSEDESNVKEQ